MSKFVSAREAIARLRIRPQTLYAYVSRGLVRSDRSETSSRARMYLLADIEALMHRKKRSRAPTAVAKTALMWGLPVLESSISLVERGRLFYRGLDAVRLAEEGATLEDVAQLLWQCQADADPFATINPGPKLPRSSAMSPLSRAIAYLSGDTSDAVNCETGASIVRRIAGVLADRSDMSRPVHVGFSRAWGLSAAQSEVIRIALVLSAEHELNASTFTVRCVASTGAKLNAILTGGLSALSGDLHGGLTSRAARFFKRANHLGINRACQEQFQHYGHLPGFGHPLYPDGDPRSIAMLSILKSRFAERLLDAAARIGSSLPNLDFGLAAIEHAFHLPEDAGLSLFAAGRTVGWIAHAMEQVQTGALIRPRARYVGPRPR